MHDDASPLQPPSSANPTPSTTPTAATATKRAKKIAYLVNQYPMVSHTFIRREIHALEEQGFEIARFSVRDTCDAGAGADDADRQEADRTTVLLEKSARGALSLARATLSRLRSHPRAFAEAALIATRLARRSDRPLQHVAYFAEAAQLAEELDRARVEHVHAHFGTNSTTVALLAEALGGPSFSFTAHGPEEFDKPDLIALRDKIERSRFVVAVSSFGRSQLLRRTRAHAWHKVKIVPCGVDDVFLSDAALRPLPAARRLVCVGRLCEQKGQLLLLDAAARIHDETRGQEPFEIVFVGDGEMRPHLEEQLRARGLERHVKILGWTNGARVRDEINASRALVLPSFAEGLPVVLMEALALQRPVISTYVAGIPELVDAQCGWLVPAGDPVALAQAMQQALSASPAELERMGAEGRRRVLERHDARKAAKLLADALGSPG